MRLARTLPLLLLLPLAAGAASRPARALARPNILFLLSDDQRWDTLGVAGNRVIRTPNLDALAREGTRFRNAFVTTPICAASRASLLTGLYERTHRYTFGTPPIRPEHVEQSYPVRFRAAGYRTGFIGKFGVNVPSGQEARMFDQFTPLNRTPYFKKQPDGTERWLEDIAGDRAVEFLSQSDPRPFCLSVSFNAPHAEDNDPRQYVWPRELDGLYDDVTFRRPRSMTPEFFQAQPDFLRYSESRVRFNWRFDEESKYQRMVRGYYRMITGVDRVVGRIREALRQRGLAENTVIVYSSDNGYFLGERGFADKWYGYEESLRVPLIVFDPRRRQHAETDAVSLNVDIPPTLLDLAGVTLPASYQGRSLAPLLEGGRPRNWRRDFFFEHLFERANIPKSEGVRDARYTYIRWFDQQPVVEELYDRRRDPDQMRNLVADPRRSGELDRLRRRTDELRDRYGGPYRPHSRAASTGG